MPDREKVIRELKAARLFFEMGSNRSDGVVGNLGCKSGMKYIDDALALLKEQEAVEPEMIVLNEIDRIYRCPKCHKCLFYEKQKFCDHCGKAVKWE